MQATRKFVFDAHQEKKLLKKPYFTAAFFTFPGEQWWVTSGK